jgi:hypothetical protein
VVIASLTLVVERVADALGVDPETTTPIEMIQRAADLRRSSERGHNMRPMSEAPRDGTRLLVWMQGEAYIAHWNDLVRQWNSHDWLEFPRESDLAGWMPLPRTQADETHIDCGCGTWEHHEPAPPPPATCGLGLLKDSMRDVRRSREVTFYDLSIGTGIGIVRLSAIERGTEATPEEAFAIGRILEGAVAKADQEPITPERLEAAGFRHAVGAGWLKGDLYLWMGDAGWRCFFAGLRPRTMGHLKALIEMTESVSD